MTGCVSFEIVLRYLSNNLDLGSFDSAVAALGAGHRYNVPDLVAAATASLFSHISKHSVLILLQACQSCHDREGPPPVTTPPSRRSSWIGSPTASKPLVEPPQSSALVDPNQNENTSEKRRCCSTSCENLFSSCLQYIDRHARQVLLHQQFVQLDSSLVSTIISRDSLQLSSEVTVVKALANWAESRGSAALCGLQYLVRYFNISKKDFKLNVVGRGLLTPQEEDSIIQSMEGEVDLPEHLQQLRYLMSSPRQTPSGNLKKSNLKYERIGAGSEDKPVPSTSSTRPLLVPTEKISILDEIFLCLTCFLD